MKKVLVMTPEKCRELRAFFVRNDKFAAYERMRAAMSSVDLDGLITQWEDENNGQVRTFNMTIADYLLAHIEAL